MMQSLLWTDGHNHRTDQLKWRATLIRTVGAGNKLLVPLRSLTFLKMAVTIANHQLCQYLRCAGFARGRTILYDGAPVTILPQVRRALKNRDTNPVFLSNGMTGRWRWPISSAQRRWQKMTETLLTMKSAKTQIYQDRGVYRTSSADTLSSVA